MNKRKKRPVAIAPSTALTHHFRYPRDGVTQVELIGAGATGSHLFSALCDIALTLPQIMDHRITVRVWDGDTVSQANLGRQRFYSADIGRNKAEVLVQRANSFLGLDFVAAPQFLTERYGAFGHDYTSRIIVGCVDTARARRVIEHLCVGDQTYWLDCGNKATVGQAILGQAKPQYGTDTYGRLPSVMDLFPILRDPSQPEDDEPSCSVAEAIAKQDLFINRAVATAAGEMLWALLKYGQLNYHGRFINSKQGTSTKLKIDPQEWKRFGFKGARRPSTRANGVARVSA